LPLASALLGYNFNVSNSSTGAKFEKLIEIMATLRGPNGCPWDKQQDFDSLKPMLVEEVYEVLEAVEEKNFDGLSEELGDLLLHIVFHAQLGKESEQFDINTVLDKISEKLVRRHPHVFGDETASTPEEVIKNWEAIKAQEKAAKLRTGLPSNLRCSKASLTSCPRFTKPIRSHRAPPESASIGPTLKVFSKSCRKRSGNFAK